MTKADVGVIVKKSFDQIYQHCTVTDRKGFQGNFKEDLKPVYSNLNDGPKTTIFRVAGQVLGKEVPFCRAPAACEAETQSSRSRL